MIVERSQDPDGERGRAALLGELQQRVEVVPRIMGERGRQGEREAAREQLRPSPGDHAVSDPRRSEVGAHRYRKRPGNCASKPADSASAMPSA